MTDTPETTQQQRLITAAFGVYKRNMEEKQFSVSVETPVPQGEDLVFRAGRLGCHIGSGVYEVAEFIQHMVNTHKLYVPGKTRFFALANGEQFEAFFEDTPEVCFKRADDFYAARTAEYHASPEYAAQQEAQAQQIAANVQACHEVGQQLEIGMSLLNLARWIVRYVPAANMLGAVTVEHAEMIVERLEFMGYVKSEGVSAEHKPETFEERVRYLAGQILSYYKQPEGPQVPHPHIVAMTQHTLNLELEIVDESVTSDD